ncbi:MAG: cation:proton antiporter [Candidatus Sericytochromatia bacterium]|nr:cation:proton antiporter [Candidatus Sericytochromatia bacterium]
MTEYLLFAFIFLGSAMVTVPLAVRWGLGSVLGYLIAGVMIGPVTGLVGSEAERIQHIAEFGVVMMLFLVGLELEPRHLWHMRWKLLGLGGLQLSLTAAGLMGLALVLGVDWQQALALGVILALSSTAIVLQTLGEKGQLKSDGGQATFSVLLFQDIAVIPILALLPLLSNPKLANHHASSHSSLSLVEGRPGWQITLITLAAIAAVVAGGVFASKYLFRFMAATKKREIFTLTVLALVIAIALLMSLVGLSPALGTFIAGVVLATSEYRHEIESDLEPFKGLLLGIFFITVGAGINFSLLLGQPALILGLTLGVMALKAGVLGLISHLFQLQGGDKFLFSLGLAQAGEFGFVLVSFTLANAILPQAIAQLLLLIITLSMFLTPFIFILLDRVLLPQLAKSEQREADVIDKKGDVIIAGTGRFGQIANRMLRANGYETVVIDYRASMVESMKHFGVKVFYGDAARHDLLEAAGLKDAKLLFIAIDDKEKTLEIAHFARKARPDLHIVARAYDREHVYQLYQTGVNDIVRETFDSATRAALYALVALGYSQSDAREMVDLFIDRDKKLLRELAGLWDPDLPVEENRPYLLKAKEMSEQLAADMLARQRQADQHRP